jgi:diaminopimelate epimerase
MSELKFTKMEGLGNDYVFVDCVKVETRGVRKPSELAPRISDRHFGVGSDGLILIKPSRKADFTMEMYNADGSQAEMCGNGLRCVAKYIHDHKLKQEPVLNIETGAGVLQVKLTVKGGQAQMVEVDMGEPILTRKDIPMLGEGEQCLNEDLYLEDGVHFPVTAVSMGNPHVVSFIEDVEHFPLSKYGPLIENNNLFPNRTNVEFVEVREDSLRQRTWERGSGETMACGTGACAVLVAAVLNDLSPRKNTVTLNGGSLTIEWREDNHVVMTGPAREVFSGTWTY